MNRQIVVFLGPTLARDEASSILEATYLPPADQGAVFYAVEELAAEAVLLIDGVFCEVPAVRHKELLWALSKRIPVLGAASMGALRAAELAAFGMIGVGLIYRWYRATAFADDDEVAVGMTPVSLPATACTDALINIRIMLRRAMAAGLIDESARIRLLEIARSIPFTQRTYDRLFTEARSVLPRTERRIIQLLERWISANKFDQKRADAIQLLRLVANQPKLLEEASARTPSWAFPVTEAWRTDLLACHLSIQGLDQPSNSKEDD